MSTTIEDVMYEKYMEDQGLEDLMFEKIDDNELENIKDYYLSDKEVLKPIITSINLAKDLSKKGFFTSSLIHSNIAIELVIKELLVSPILSGSILNEFISELVTNHIMGARSISVFDKIARFLPKEKASIDLQSYQGTDLWLRIKEMRSLRNKVAHNGQEIKEEDSDLALKTIDILFEGVIKDLLKEFELNVSKGEIKRAK